MPELAAVMPSRPLGPCTVVDMKTSWGSPLVPQVHVPLLNVNPGIRCEVLRKVQLTFILRDDCGRPSHQAVMGTALLVSQLRCRPARTVRHASRLPPWR